MASESKTEATPERFEEILGEDDAEPTREEVAAELILFIREAVREMGERKASGFLKKFYGWYLGRGRFPRPFKQELVQLETTDEVVTRLLAAAPGAAGIVEKLEGGNLPLEDSLRAFEEGMELCRRGTVILDGAEKKVETLLAAGRTAPFEVEER